MPQVRGPHDRVLDRGVEISFFETWESTIHIDDASASSHPLAPLTLASSANSAILTPVQSKSHPRQDPPTHHKSGQKSKVALNDLEYAYAPVRDQVRDLREYL